MKLDASARTHAGKVRQDNEDAYLCRPREGLFAVIDGMGGHAGGEVAAALALDALAAVPNLPGLAGETLLAAAMRAARQRILEEAADHPDHAGLGAVATALRLDDDGAGASLVHVGDTRAYLCTASGVRQLTRDHVAADATPKPAVTRDLGRRQMDEEWLEVSRVALAAGDLVVLCSDGLYDVLPPEALAGELVRLRKEGAGADEVATRLLSRALAAGAPDNVTVCAVRPGAFRRRAPGAPGARAGLRVAAALAALVGAAALGASLREPPPPSPAQLPGALSARADALSGASVEVAPGTLTALEAGAELDLHGVTLRGGSWEVRVCGGCALWLSRARIEGTAVVVDAAPGATVRASEVEVVDGRLTFRGAGADVRVEHVRLEAAEDLVLEAPDVVHLDVRTVSGEWGIEGGGTDSGEAPSAG